MTNGPTLKSSIVGERLRLAASGPWTAPHADELERQVQALEPAVSGASTTSIDMSEVRELDTLGAWVLERLLRSARQNGRVALFVAMPAHFRGLIDEVQQVNRQPPPADHKINSLSAAFNTIGRTTVEVKASLLTLM